MHKAWWGRHEFLCRCFFRNSSLLNFSQGHVHVSLSDLLSFLVLLKLIPLVCSVYHRVWSQHIIFSWHKVLTYLSQHGVELRVEWRGFGERLKEFLLFYIEQVNVELGVEVSRNLKLEFKIGDVQLVDHWIVHFQSVSVFHSLSWKLCCQCRVETESFSHVRQFFSIGFSR